MDDPEAPMQNFAKLSSWPSVAQSDREIRPSTATDHRVSRETAAQSQSQSAMRSENFI